MNELKTECLEKIRRCREVLGQANLDAVVFRGVDFFSWITAGASSTVILTTETGIAEVVITATNAVVMTDTIEEPRLKTETLVPLDGAFDIVAHPWEQSDGRQVLLKKIVGATARVCSDRPLPTEVPLPAEILRTKRQLVASEISRYRKLGFDAAEAMTVALREARPGLTEFDLAAVGSRELLKRGIDPTLILVAGEHRLLNYRHPVATMGRLENRCMMVFCGRRHGLYADLTRLVFFSEPTSQDTEALARLEAVEATMLAASTPGRTLAEVFADTEAAYRREGFPHELVRHHQGGTTGYLSREVVARGDTETRLELNNAVAWNPSLPGLKIEDTILVGANGATDVLTHDGVWPTRVVNGIARPIPWVNKNTL